MQKIMKTMAAGCEILDRKVAGKMLFCLVLLLCFSGIVAVNPGTSWRNGNAFAALKNDGTVIAWGDGSYGGTAPSGLTNVATIYSTG
jgi:hypothetical protein